MSCARGCCETQLEHYRSVNLSAAATPTRSGPILSANKKDEQFTKDAAAYKSMRKDGLQPPSVDGSADLAAKANDPIEVQTGKPMSKEAVSLVKEISGEVAP